MYLSIIVPAFNEEGNISELCSRIKTSLKDINYELILVNDGSKDNTLSEMLSCKWKDKHIKVVNLKKNKGQSAALMEGFKKAEGKLVATLDADLQNDPEDISLMIREMTGHDVICGWRKYRKDGPVKNFLSRLANLFRRAFTGESIHDAGCGIKLFKDKCLESLDLKAGQHRFITTILFFEGFNIKEIPVKHHPRKRGKTKYGAIRVLRGFFDLINILIKYKFN